MKGAMFWMTICSRVVISIFEQCLRCCEGKRKRCHSTGGLEAARLKDWHVKGLAELDLRGIYFAYDTPDDLDPL